MTRHHEPHFSWADYGFHNDIPAEDLRAMQDRFDTEQEAAGDAHRADERRADWLARWGIPIGMVIGALIWALLITWLAG